MIVQQRVPNHSDILTIEAMVRATNVFSDEEIRVAAELAESCRDLGEQASGYHFLFAETAGKILGYLCYGRIPFTQCSVDLYWIATHTEHQGQGIAKRLLQAMESRIAPGTVYAETSGRSDYAAARAFYLKSGFELCAEFTDFYAPGDNKLVFSKTLPR